MGTNFSNVEQLLAELAAHKYLADKKLATTVYLALKLTKPLLVEGPAGVGKTELAKVLAGVIGSPLVRLQCYEGLDEGKALYQWNYQMQLLRLQTLQQGAADWTEVKKSIYVEEFLLERPLLKALRSEPAAVLLIDEMDKSDEEFESFLLETLSDFQISIPELGTVEARTKPVIVITSNGLRDFSDAFRRRCIHLYIEYPDFDRELEIVKTRLPQVEEHLAAKIVQFVQGLRRLDIKKAPSISETLDWANSLLYLGTSSLDNDSVKSTLSVLLKNKQDEDKVSQKLDQYDLQSHKW